MIELHALPNGAALQCLSNIAPIGLQLDELKTHEIKLILSSIPSARYVGLAYSDQLAALPSIVEHIGVAELDRSHLSHLAQVPRLATLSTWKTNVANDDIKEHLARLPVTTLALRNSSLIQTGAIASIASLESLDLQASRIGDEDLAALASLSRLTVLNVTMTKLTDAADFSGFEGLHELEIGLTSIGDNAFATLANHKSLTILTANGTPLQNCANTLATLTSLRAV